VAALLGYELHTLTRRGNAACDRHASVPSADGRATDNALAAEKSIAVLPFIDMSQKKDQEYFSDGLSEELIDHLVHSADLKVIARTSSFQFKGRNDDVRAVARALGVTHVLEGSVRQNGQQLRITAQLVRASDGVQLWSQTYDRNLTDIFKVQDDIADEVSRALHVALRGAPPGVNRHPMSGRTTSCWRAITSRHARPWAMPKGSTAVPPGDRRQPRLRAGVGTPGERLPDRGNPDATTR
jgi:TolB-like protein